jgi:hypothetical protein
MASLLSQAFQNAKNENRPALYLLILLQEITLKRSH